MKPLGIGIVGAANGHTDGYCRVMSSHPGVKQVAIYDDLPGRAEQWAGRHGIDEVCSGWEEVIDHPKVDAVIVGSVNRDHFPQMMAAIGRGKPLISMKVPSTDPEECRVMQEAWQRAGLPVLCDLGLRYCPGIDLLRDKILNGDLGRIHSIAAVNDSLFPYSMAAWMGDPVRSYGRAVSLKPGDPRFRGGCLTDHPHIFDLVPWITGVPFRMMDARAGANIRPMVPVEDNVFARAELLDGTQIHLDPSYSCREIPLEPIQEDGHDKFELGQTVSWPKPVVAYMEVHGDRGCARGDFLYPTVYLTAPDNQRYACTYVQDNGINGMVSDFIRCARHGGRCKASGEDGVAAARVVYGAYESISTGQPHYFGAM